MEPKLKEIFINLPVADLKKSVAFFEQLGFKFEPKYTDDNGTCLILGDNIFAMLLTHDFFSSFTTRGIADTASVNEVILAFNLDSREETDAFLAKALEAGAVDRSTPLRPEEEAMGMYYFRIADPDGHLWEFGYMDPVK